MTIVKNSFKIKDIVELTDSFSEIFKKGEIEAIACKEALPSIKKCARTTCAHKIKEFVWVRWKNNKLIAYSASKLSLVDFSPKIGKELSGRIGPWEYNAKTKLWRKDSIDRDFTEEQFADEMYYEAHPHAKEEADYLMKQILIATRPTVKR